jgi:hypothetical protein
MLARNAMKSFQDESRIASGQVGVALGLSRLTADLQRAGYMASPNVATDPRRCPAVDPDDVPIAAVQIDEGGSAEDAAVAAAGYDLAENAAVPDPDMLVISGNMTSAEQFEYRGISAGKLYLAANRAPAQRAYEDVGKDERAFCEIFVPDPDDDDGPGRFARLVEPSGKESYVIVTACDADDDAALNLSKVELTIVDPSTGLPPSTAGSTCGARPGGGLINPVSIIRYRLAQLCDPYACDDPDYAAALRSTGPNEVTGESSRLELVREEIAPADAGDPFALDFTPTSRELVAEFAVDLDFAFVVADDEVNLEQPTNLAYLPFGSTDAETMLPQRVRSVRVRLATRARVPDRDEPIDTGVTTRFLLPGVLARNKYARMRTLHGDVTLPNLQQVTW